MTDTSRRPIDTAVTPTEANDAAPRRWRDDPWTVATSVAAVVLTALVLWPLYDVACTALDLIWRPSGDWAAIVLRTEDVGRLTPLVGPYSRFGWNHPGPLLFWVLSIPYHLFGGRPESILAATAFVNGVTVAAIAVVSWRRGRLPLVAFTMGAIAVLFHALGPALLRDPWNPYITLLPLALVALLSWSVTEGDRWMWIPLAFVASFELQSHVGYLPMLATVLVATAILVWRRRSSAPLLPPPGATRRWFVLLLSAVLVICWFPVLVDQLTGTGNAMAILDWFRAPEGSAAGFGTALHQMAGQLRVATAPWLGEPERAAADGQLLGASLSALVLPFTAMGASLWFAVRTRARAAVRFQVLVCSLALGGLIATARVIGPVYDWIVRWWWVIACLWWLSIAWAVWSGLVRFVRSRDLERALTTTIAAIGALVILAAVTPVVERSHRAVAPNASTSQILGNFLDPMLVAVAGRGPVFVETTGSVRGDYGDAIRYALERAGIDVAVAPGLVTHFGPERSIERRGANSTLWVVSADAIDGFRSDPTMIELGGWDPLAPDERAAFRLDAAELASQLRAVGRDDLALALTNGGGGVDSGAAGLDGIDQDLLRRVESIRRRGDPIAIFLGPAPTD